jgi:uncharacterized protein with von Willebrand factor type A (vWA) domain
MPRAARGRRPTVAVSRSILLPPNEHCWIESDAYDRSAFAAVCTGSPALDGILETGNTLVPHFRPLLEDVFCSLFKLTPQMRAPTAVAPAAAFNRTLLESLRGHVAHEVLHAETQLDEVQSGLATVLLGERLVELLRAEALVPRGDLRDLWDVAHEEEKLRARAEEVKDLEASKAPPEAQEGAADAARVAEARLRQKSQLLRERLGEMPARARTALPAAAAEIARTISQTTEQVKGWGTGLGSEGRQSPAQQIELGRRLVRNPKLQQLAAVVGRMRAMAMALRKRQFERRSEEVHAVEWTGALEHLLPPELVTLRHPVLRRDFQRRLVEGRLLGYHLRGREDRGRGPLIVCLDGSGSMSGDKEIWAKAVALTLLEIARRQRRLFRFIGFSSADTPLYVLDLNPREHHRVHVDRAFDLAEYFPGGGTDFETPLRAAVDGLREARYRRGDVVLITDGECQVSPEWMTWYQREKAQLKFALFSVLIDVGPSALATVEALSDRVTSVSRLNDNAVRDLFLEL